MAALQINHNFQRINNSFSKEELRFKKAAALISLRPTNCQKPDQGGDRRPKKSKPESPEELNGFVAGVVKLGRDLKERLSPKRKGDWNDVVLMSLSFAVYIYMSQRIVCAYCAWMSMVN